MTQRRVEPCTCFLNYIHEHLEESNVKEYREIYANQDRYGHNQVERGDCHIFL